MTENLELPLHLQRLIRTGKNRDGSYTVSVQFRVTPQDEIALRGQYLVEPEHNVRGDMTGDAGGEAAVVQSLAGIIGSIRDDELLFGQTDVICGGIRAKVPPAR